MYAHLGEKKYLLDKIIRKYLQDIDMIMQLSTFDAGILGRFTSLVYIIYIYIYIYNVYLGSKSLSDCSFFKSSSEDVQVLLLVFLCL